MRYYRYHTFVGTLHDGVCRWYDLHSNQRYEWAPSTTSHTSIANQYFKDEIPRLRVLLLLGVPL